VGRRLILDTNILIAYERGTMDRSSLDDDELAIASVSVAEYRVGIEMADTADRAAERARALVAITSAVDVLDYTQATAAHHGRLLAHVRRSGSPRGAHDLIIAAHAAQTGRTILSRDAKARFGELPGVSAIDGPGLLLVVSQPIVDGPLAPGLDFAEVKNRLQTDATNESEKFPVGRKTRCRIIGNVSRELRLGVVVEIVKEQVWCAVTIGNVSETPAVWRP